jgi:hypothetical protein
MAPGDPAHHVPPLLLWQCACGGRDLPEREHDHLIACAGCETLATEIGDALNDIEKLLRCRRERAAV